MTNIYSTFEEKQSFFSLNKKVDTKSDFELYYGNLENYIYPALLGVNKQTDLNKKVNEILFIDTQTGNVLHKFKVTAWKKIIISI